MAIIETRDLVFDYIRRDEEGNVEGIITAVDNVSLSVKQGDFIAILGHNGSGKSTLAKHFNAILYPTEGTVFVDGMDTRDDEKLWDVRREAGVDGISESGQSDHWTDCGGRCGLWPGESRCADRRDLAACGREP